MPVISRPRVLIDVAPSRRLTPLLIALAPDCRVGLDFDPSADGRLVDIQASLTHLPFPDSSVDLLVCYHVLEHIPDDRRAMKEIARTLAPGGLGLIQVPWKGTLPTDEDPSASPEERIRRFGQADHVRMYGSDFEERLTEAGLSFTRISSGSVLGRPACEWINVSPTDFVWIVRPATGASRGELLPDPKAVRWLMDETLAAIDESAAMRRRLRSRSRALRTVRAELDRCNQQLNAPRSRAELIGDGVTRSLRALARMYRRVKEHARALARH